LGHDGRPLDQINQLIDGNDLNVAHDRLGCTRQYHQRIIGTLGLAAKASAKGGANFVMGQQYVDAVSRQDKSRCRRTRRCGKGHRPHARAQDAGKKRWLVCFENFRCQHRFPFADHTADDAALEILDFDFSLSLGLNRNILLVNGFFDPDLPLHEFGFEHITGPQVTGCNEDL